MTNKPSDLFFGLSLFGILLFFVWMLVIHQENKTLEPLKSGDFTLICYISEQHKAIEPAKIVDKVDSTYIFTNGYASNCKILKVPYSTLEK